MTGLCRQVVYSLGLPWPLASRFPYWTLIGSVPETLVPTAVVGTAAELAVAAEQAAAVGMQQRQAVVVVPQVAAVGTELVVVERTVAAEQAAVYTDDQPSMPLSC